MFGLGTWEIIIVGGVILLLFGPTMLPKLCRSLGQSVSAFRKSVREVEEAIDDGDEHPKG